jgi:hypothetical protein
LKINELALCIDLCARAKITPFIWGKHGIGKSSTVKQVAFANDMGFIDNRLSQCEASDLRGLPDRDRETQTTIYYAPANFPRADLSMEEVINQLEGVLYDEDRTLDCPSAHGMVEGITQLQQIRLARKAKRYPRYEVVGDKTTVYFDGPPIPYNIIVALDKLHEAIQPRMERGLYLLDEMNRAEDDVLQSSFEVVLDRKCGMHVIPEGWAIIAAGNPSEDYAVNRFMSDPALVDRFCHLTLEGGKSTMDGWGNWMLDEFGEDARKITEFALQNVDHIYGPAGGGQNDLNIGPTPRSWAHVAKIEIAAKESEINYPEKVMIDVIGGLIGSGLASKYVKFNCPVQPRKIVEQGVSSQIGALRDQLNKDYKRGILGSIVFGVLSFARDSLDNAAHINNCLDFAQWLAEEAKENDLCTAYMRQLISGATSDNGGDDGETTKAALVSNARLGKLVSKWRRDNEDEIRIIDELNKRPELQKLMELVSWGREERK